MTLEQVGQELENDFEPVRPNMDAAMMPQGEDFAGNQMMRLHNSSQPMIVKNLQKQAS